ncbi:DUF2294 domain-containing protein [Microcoleus sp. FACHB-1515]|uniref:DUF2294 domain-containing protein n=1 Tax=Cyanophyceae TaxID=3028117 RepID=UPI001682BA78|nr:DUF2294 domain-containing protein [Microcoleus sp. FACHB-1515]MBD2089985.1 DUF2294 domain-containing protein [Microcoleus sp. FACHB-1515]
MDQSSNFTRGQLERTLSQRIEALYRNQLGHRPTKVTCHLFDEKIAIVMEDAVTPPEQLLARNGQEELAEQVRDDLDRVLQPQLCDLIGEVLGVTVKEILSDAKLDTGRTGMIAILESPPLMREANSKAPPRKVDPA